MGLQVESDVWRLVFEEGPLAGLEMRLREASLDTLAALRSAGGLSDGDDLTPQDAQVLDGIAASLADALVSWDVELDGRPVPATTAGIRSLPLRVTAEIVAGWIRAVHQHALDGGEPAAGESDESELLASMRMQPLTPPAT